MDSQICSWPPELVVELIKIVVWPIVVLLIGFRFRSGISESLRTFLNRNTVSEVSATASGVSAKFVAAKQSTEALESGGSKVVNLPETMSVEAISERHEFQKTEFSEELFRAIKTHLSALDITIEEKLDIVARETSLLQSATRYFDINRVLFRSQFNMFSTMASNADFISMVDAENNFKSIKELVGEAFNGWDWIKYSSYPVSSGIIRQESDGYKLTELGKSYVSFMSNNPQLVDELAKL
jgi:hypothetical protein